jgi:hypothetical protein
METGRNVAKHCTGWKCAVQNDINNIIRYNMTKAKRDLRFSRRRRYTVWSSGHRIM